MHSLFIIIFFSETYAVKLDYTYGYHSEVGLNATVHISDGDGDFAREKVEPGLESVNFGIPASQGGLGGIDIAGEVTRGGTGQRLRACKVDRPSIKRTQFLLETVMRLCLRFE